MQRHRPTTPIARTRLSLDSLFVDTLGDRIVEQNKRQARREACVSSRPLALDRQACRGGAANYGRDGRRKADRVRASRYWLPGHRKTFTCSNAFAS